jgi:GT2 family glycosyltransferase
LVSVIIATRARPALLRGALGSILNGDYTNIELIVVDNSVTGDSRATVASLARDEPRITYLWEPAPGMSRARNTGSACAAGELLVFTDDDVIVASTWISSMVRTFAGDPTSECVTGLIVPAELETPAQLWIWRVSSLSKGYRPRVFHAGAANLPALFPFRLGVYGSGANLAVRADVYSALDGFDEALGVGTQARGGEDLDFFLRLMLDGRRLAYEPAAYLRHNDYRRFDDALVQRYGYGVGLAAVLTKHLMTKNRQLLFRLAPQGVWYLLSPRSPKNAGKVSGYPRILSLAEFAGLARGPFTYWRSRHAKVRSER